MLPKTVAVAVLWSVVNGIPCLPYKGQRENSCGTVRLGLCKAFPCGIVILCRKLAIGPNASGALRETGSRAPEMPLWRSWLPLQSTTCWPIKPACDPRRRHGGRFRCWSPLQFLARQAPKGIVKIALSGNHVLGKQRRILMRAQRPSRGYSRNDLCILLDGEIGAYGSPSWRALESPSHSAKIWQTHRSPETELLPKCSSSPDQREADSHTGSRRETRQDYSNVVWNSADHRLHPLREFDTQQCRTLGSSDGIHPESRPACLSHPKWSAVCSDGDAQA
jgi:hypothetical protein